MKANKNQTKQIQKDDDNQKETAVVVQNQSFDTQAIKMMPMSLIKSWYEDFVKFSKEILKEGLDYGVIPGVEKPSLLKPGAEKLRLVYGLGVEVSLVSSKEDLDKGYLDYTYKATVKNKDGQVVAECEGNANSYETKWRYEWVATSKMPSKAESEALKAKKLGKWVKQPNGGYIWYERVENPNVLGLKNTIIKMAQKRAFVGAILIATGASEFFTQDVEEIVEEVPSVENPTPKVKEEERRHTLLMSVVNKLKDRNLITQEEYDLASSSYEEARKLIEKIKERQKNALENS